MAITLRKLSEHIGAEVDGIDIAKGVDEGTFAQLRKAFCEHAVLVFHDQQLNDDQHVAFSEGFGSLEPSLASDPLGDGFLFRISNVDDKGEIIPPDDKRALYTAANTLWHSDGAFRRDPLRASLLSAQVVPPSGGETEYACLRAAYNALPSERKTMLDGLVVTHSMAHSRAQIAPDIMPEDFQKDTPPAKHPIVRTITETGEKVLFVGSYACGIVGWQAEEGLRLLEDLLEWATQPQFVYQHVWRVHDLVMWDNRLCLHRGRPWESTRYKRIMRRTTLAGDGPTVKGELT